MALDTSMQQYIRDRIVVDESGCWIWQRQVNWKGYGASKIAGRTVMAHRRSYAAFVGPIPDGLPLDHLCRVRRCVNPAHLEPVTTRENNLRSSHANSGAVRNNVCKRGHEFTDANTHRRADGRRLCKTCNAANKRTSRARLAEVTS